MQILQSDKIMPQRLNMSTTRKRKQREKLLIRILAWSLTLSGLLVVCVLSVSRLVSRTTVEEPATKEVLTTSQTPINTSTAVEDESESPAQLAPEKELYTNDELYCMAVVIYNEAGGDSCTDEQRELVGYVVLNRTNDSRYPDSIREVLEQPRQYADLGSNGVYFAKRASNSIEGSAVKRAWDTARRVLENRNDIPVPDNVVFQAQFAQGIGTYKQIGNTYFCYAEEVE